jgi:hypothetical protein
MAVATCGPGITVTPTAGQLVPEIAPSVVATGSGSRLPSTIRTSRRPESGAASASSDSGIRTERGEQARGLTSTSGPGALNPAPPRRSPPTP